MSDCIHSGSLSKAACVTQIRCDGGWCSSHSSLDVLTFFFLQFLTPATREYVQASLGKEFNFSLGVAATVGLAF